MERIGDYINRETFISDTEKRYCDVCKSGGGKFSMDRSGEMKVDWCCKCWIQAMFRELKRALTADVVPVVRCRYCKHWHEDIGWCDIHSHFQSSNGEFCHPWESSDWKMFPPDYFCADGKRREKND